MVYIVLKYAISALLIVLISEIAQRSSFIGAIIASIPIVSVLAIIWLYIDTQNRQQVSQLSSDIFWLVLPSLVFFISLPLLLRTRLHFYVSMSIACVLTIIAYTIMIAGLKFFGVR